MPISATFDDTPMSIKASELGFTYPGSRRETLRGLSFSVQPGQIYGFLGPSGAGKSTTQKILYRLLSNYSGSVKVADREITAWGREIYAAMGIGFETPSLYLKLTGRENLEFARALHDAARPSRPGLDRGSRSTPASALTIDDAADRLGLAEAIDDRVETYSKGMRMRLAFIRAVLHRPHLLFLDEPTSGLDPSWARRIKDWILELREAGTVTFLTTHSMELADELCDTVGFLVDGSLMAQESPEALKQRYGRPGVVVRGVSSDGQTMEMDVSYEDALRSALGELAGVTRITRITNREVSLEQVFLKVTGRSLQPRETVSEGGQERSAPVEVGD